MNGHIDERFIALLAGDDLEPKRKAKIFRHLSGCLTCRRMLDEYLEERECLAQLKGQSVTDYDYASLKYSILGFIEAKQTKSTWSSLRWAVSGPALLIMAIAFLMIWDRTHLPNPPEKAAHLVQYGPTDKHRHYLDGK